MASAPVFALSIKQPWAALIVHGLKTIEVRRWPTARRGHLLIHAARIPDDRPEAWRHLPDRLRECALLQGGIIGSVELTECRTYRSLDAFVADQAGHLNEATWFELPQLYGFTFAGATTLPFRPYPGWFRFFSVKESLSPKRKSKHDSGVTR